MNRKKVKLGLIGAGNIARKHMEVIADINWLEAVGITSRTKDKAERFAKEYGIKICSQSIDRLIKEAKPDALLVMVSAEESYKVISQVLTYRLPLFTEKPAGLTPGQSSELARLAKSYSVKTMVGFNRRYYSIFHKGINIIRNQGRLYGITIEGHERMWRRADRLSETMRSNWIFANNTHMIDLLRFFGGEPEKISSIVQSFIEPRGDQFGAIMEFPNRVIGQYSAHWYSPGGWRVVLYGEGVTVEFKPLENGSWTDKDFKLYSIEPDEVDIKYKAGFFRQMEAFGRLVQTGSYVWPMLDLEGALRTMVLAEQLAFKPSVDKVKA